MSAETAPETAPVEAPPPAAPPNQPAKEAPAAEPEKVEHEPEKAPGADIAAEVMRQRDARQLGELVREKKALEAKAASFKESEAKLAAFAKIERLLDDEDDASAIEALLQLKAGDRYKDRLASTYNALTDRMLKGQNAPKQSSAVERSVSRLEKDFEQLKHEKAQTEARLAEKEAEERDRAVQGAVESIGSYLKDLEHDYPFLMAEADEPADIVWAIIEEADRAGKELTLGEAAKLANDHFQPAFERKAPRYQSLLAPNKGEDKPAKPEDAQPKLSAPPRKSLTNADASQVSNQKTLPPAKSDDERIDRGWEAFRRALTK
jgi:hypothetical protein